MHHAMPRASRRPRGDYAAPLDKLRASIEEQYVDRVRSMEPAPRLSHLTSSAAGAQHKTTGRERHGRLNEALDGFDLVRSKGQRMFHRNMTMAVIRKLYKDDFAEELEYLREQFRADIFKPEVLIITPRRFGKCLGPNDLVLMANGETRRAADIQVGDVLVGDDGRARIVMNTCTGNAPTCSFSRCAGRAAHSSARKSRSLSLSAHLIKKVFSVSTRRRRPTRSSRKQTRTRTLHV
jgi:hypothetical protein